MRNGFQNRWAGGSELAAGAEGWLSTLTVPGSVSSAMLWGGGGKGRQEAAAAAEQLLSYLFLLFKCDS